MKPFGWNIPVFLNFEHGHADPNLLKRYAGRATICQAVTDAAQLGEEPPLEVARKLLGTGVKTALITLAGEGCLAAQGERDCSGTCPSGRGSGWLRSRSHILRRLHLWLFEGLETRGYASLCDGRGLAQGDPARPATCSPFEEILALGSKLRGGTADCCLAER